MTPELAAIATLAAFALVAAAVVAWQAWRNPSGPMIWWLYVAERLACGLLWRVRGCSKEGRSQRCPYPENTGALIVANHRSPADPILLWQNHHLASRGRTIRPISFLMAREYYDNRWLNWFYRAMRAIPVARNGSDSQAVRDAMRRLKAGELVGIFPEGGINHGPPGVAEGNPGVAFLALSTDVPVYPVYIAGSPVGTTMVNSVLRAARARLIYGEPIDLSDYRGRKKDPALLREVTERIMTAVADLGGVSYTGQRRLTATSALAESGSPADTDGENGEKVDHPGSKEEAPMLRPWPREAPWRKTS